MEKEETEKEATEEEKEETEEKKEVVEECDIMLYIIMHLFLTLPPQPMEAIVERKEKKEGTVKRKEKKEGTVKRKKKKIGTPRPRNSYMIFRKDIKDLIEIIYVGINENDLSRVAGKIWAKLPKYKKDYYSKEAEIEKDKHKSMYPNYKYRPQKKPAKKTNFEVQFYEYNPHLQPGDQGGQWVLSKEHIRNIEYISHTSTV